MLDQLLGMEAMEAMEAMGAMGAMGAMRATNGSRAVCARQENKPPVFDLKSIIIWRSQKVLGAPTGGLWPLVHVGDAPCLFGLASMRRPASAWGTIRDLQGSSKPILQGGSVGIVCT